MFEAYFERNFNLLVVSHAIKYTGHLNAVEAYLYAMAIYVIAMEHFLPEDCTVLRLLNRGTLLL